MTLLRLRTVARVGVRTLLVAGFAGGAWLLSSAAAHAASPEGLAATGVTGPAQAVSTPAISLLGQVLTPVTSVEAGQAPVTTRVHHTVRSAVAPVTRMSVPRVASQAERAEQPTLSHLITSVTNLVRPLTGATQQVSTPLSELLALPAGPPTRVLAIARPAPVTRVDTRAVAPAGAVPGCTAAPAVGGAQHEARARSSAGTATAALPVVHRYAASGTATVPTRPERAPLPAFPDSGTHGISTMASGSQHDAGGYAVVSSAAEPGQVAAVRRLRATEVAVRLLLADAPTVAPD